MKKILYTLTYSLLLLITPLTHAYSGYYPQQNNIPPDPVQYIQSALEKMGKFTGNSDTTNPALVRAFIETEIIPHFSFDDMSRWITGPFARRMSQTDRVEFQAKLKIAFLNSLSRHFGSFNALRDRVRFFPTQHRGNDDAIVSARIYREDNYPAKLEFRMRRTGPDWKIIDVSADGLSAVVYYRRHFMADLRQYGR